MKKQDMNTFVYYGVILTKAELYELANNFGESDVYDFVYSKGLNYQPIGQESYSNKSILGQEIVWDMSGYIIHFNIDNMTFKNEVIDDVESLNIDEKIVDEKLSNLGINIKPQYYIISSYNSI